MSEAECRVHALCAALRFISKGASEYTRPVLAGDSITKRWRLLGFWYEHVHERLVTPHAFRSVLPSFLSSVDLPWQLFWIVSGSFFRRSR